jgi:hypothetical protein
VHRRYEHCKEYRIAIIDNGLVPFWSGVIMPKHSPFYNMINFAVTDRMARLERKPIGNLMDKCLQHFFPVRRQMAVGYDPLSLWVLSGLFVILVVLLVFACVVLLVEIGCARCKQAMTASVIELNVVEDTSSDEYIGCESDIRQACMHFKIDRIVIKDKWENATQKKKLFFRSALIGRYGE